MKVAKKKELTGKKAGGVGEGRDAKGHLMPGYTANPAGGGRRSNKLEALIQTILEEQIKLTLTENGKKKTRSMPELEALIRLYLRRARKGNHQAFREILDRAFGRPRQVVDLGGQDGEGIQIVINGVSGGNGSGKVQE